MKLRCTCMKKSKQEQIQFLTSLIKKDIHHYHHQQELINQWIKFSILSLNQPDTRLLEELSMEYSQKASEQIDILKEFQKTLRMFERKETPFNNKKRA